MGETVLVPGARDVRATLDAGDADAVVVACPPHPQMGGRRTDGRLTAVSDAVAPELATLRFDYGEWDEGYGGLTDARNALSWAREEYDRVGLFGFSFGGCVALLAAAGVRAGAAGTDGGAAETDVDLRAVSALAPASKLGSDLDVTAVLDEITCPVQVVYGERDDTADWEPVVERARELRLHVESISGDHFFVGQTDKVASAVGGFLRTQV